MAEMVGFSRSLRRPTSAIGGFLAALKREWLRLVWERREPRLRMEEWPDYLLKDIGLNRTQGESVEPRDLPAGWPR